MDNKEEKIIEKIKMPKDQKNLCQTLHNLDKDMKKEIMAINQENTIILESIIIQEEVDSTITIEDKTVVIEQDNMVVIEQDNMVAIEQDNMVVIEQDSLGNMRIEDSITVDKEIRIEDKKKMTEI
jgi:hypothetical protein